MGKLIISPVFLVIALVLIYTPSSGYGVESNIARSEKRILPDDPARDKKLLKLTGNDRLTGEIIKEHALIVGSKMTIVSRRPVYAWLVEHIKVSAALSRIFGREYSISQSSVYQYHGEDKEGLSVDFYTGYRDSAMTLLVGKGKLKIFHVTFTGSFLNLMEYNNIDGSHLAAQNVMYVKVNNPVARFITHVVFAVSDIEKGIMKKLLSLDDTVFRIMKTFMEDPNLSPMLKDPKILPPENTSDLAIAMRNTVIRESSPEAACELGKLIEQARVEVGYERNNSKQ